MNAFACEQCKDIRSFIEEEFVTIEESVAQIREKVPSLVALLRERVILMSNTRADLDKLLGKLDQEKVCPNGDNDFQSVYNVFLNRNDLWRG